MAGTTGGRVFFLGLRAANLGLLSVAAGKVRAHAETLSDDVAEEAELR